MSKIHLVFGAQGAGKTSYSKALAKETKAVHFSIDEWMWKLYGADLPKPLNISWIMERVDRCEKLIWDMTKRISASGSVVILDLGFTKHEKRKQFKQLAASLNIETQLHYIKAPLTLRRQRVRERNLQKGDTYTFKVTAGMFDFMEREFQFPTETELMGAKVIDTGSDRFEKLR